jgi:hypothetical protein
VTPNSVGRLPGPPPLVRPAADYRGPTGAAHALLPERYFPEPGSVEELDSCFVLKDLNGQALAYVYFEKKPRRRFRRELLTRDEAQRIAAIFAKLPGLLKRS